MGIAAQSWLRIYEATNPFTEEDERKVKERLKALGNLD